MIKEPSDIDFVVKPVNLTAKEVAELNAMITKKKRENQEKQKKAPARRSRVTA